MKKTTLLFSILFFFKISLAQNLSQWEISLDVEASGLHLFAFDPTKEIRIDKEIFRRRRTQSIFRPNYSVSDNPNFHAASYAGLKVGTSYKNKYKLHTLFFVEDRGASYGTNDLDNIVFFPAFTFEIMDTFKVLNQQFELDISMGNLLKHQIDNGLKIYNVDVQGVDIKIIHKNFFAQYHQIGDLSFSIGLGIEEFYNYGFGYENKLIRVALTREENIMTGSSPYRSYSSWNLLGNFYPNKNTEIFFQIGHRDFSSFNIKENVGLLLGANLKVLQNKKFKWSIFPKIRFYKRNFNEGHLDRSVVYRKLNGQIYSNTVGRYLYPLRNFYYDFDQWAVYTEYQLLDIFALGLKNNFEWRFFKKFHIRSQIELLSIRREKEFFTNYLYDFDFFYMPIEGFDVGFKVTNKSYNLDAHFQTFYTSRFPMVGFHIRFRGFHGEVVLKPKKRKM